MVDRGVRDYLLEAITAFLDGTIKSAEFDRRLNEGLPRSADETCNKIALEMWFFYSDVEDHAARLNKESWDFIQRLCLVLRSNVEFVPRRRWDWTRSPLALWSVLAVALAVWRLGFGWRLLAAWEVVGGVQYLVLHWLGMRKAFERRRLGRVMPFASFGALRAVRRATLGFRKRPFPRAMEVSVGGLSRWQVFRRRIVFVPGIIVMSLVMPLILLVHLLPTRGLPDLRVGETG